MVQHRNARHCLLSISLAVTIIRSDAFISDETITNQTNCLQRLEDFDQDGSGILEQVELQRFVDTIEPLQPCTIYADSLLGDAAAEFCRLLWTRCPIDTNSSTIEPTAIVEQTVPPETNAPTPNPTVAVVQTTAPQTSAPTSNPTNAVASPVEEEIGDSVESSISETISDEAPESTSTLPPIEDDIPMAPPPEESCTFIRCHQRIMIGVPILVGLIAGLCLGLVYVESRGGWREKPTPPEEPNDADFASTAAVGFPSHSSKQIIDSDQNHRDLESGGAPSRGSSSHVVGFLRTTSLQSRSEILETLPEANEEDSEFMSDMVSHSTMGDSDTAAFSTMSDTTPLHQNKRPIILRRELDEDSTTTSSSISFSEDLDNEHDVTTKEKTKATKVTATERVIATFTQTKLQGPAAGTNLVKQTYTQPVVHKATAPSSASAPPAVRVRPMNVSAGKQSRLTNTNKAANPFDTKTPKQRRSELSKSNSWHADPRAKSFPVTEVSTGRATRRKPHADRDDTEQRRSRSLVSLREEDRSSSVGRSERRAVSPSSTRRARSAIDTLAPPQPVVLVSEELKMAVRELPAKQKSWREFQSEELSL